MATGRYVTDLDKGDVLGPIEYTMSKFVVREYCHANELHQDCFQNDVEVRAADPRAPRQAAAVQGRMSRRHGTDRARPLRVRRDDPRAHPGRTCRCASRARSPNATRRRAGSTS